MSIMSIVSIGWQRPGGTSSSSLLAHPVPRFNDSVMPLDEGTKEIDEAIDAGTDGGMEAEVDVRIEVGIAEEVEEEIEEEMAITEGTISISS